MREQVRRRRAPRRDVRGRQQPGRRRLRRELQARAGLHLQAAAARRQHPGAGHLPRLRDLAPRHRARGGRPDQIDHGPRRHDARRRRQADLHRPRWRRRGRLDHQRHDVQGLVPRRQRREPHHQHHDDPLEQRQGRLREPMGRQRRAMAGHQDRLLLRQHRLRGARPGDGRDHPLHLDAEHRHRLRQGARRRADRSCSATGRGRRTTRRSS